MCLSEVVNLNSGTTQELRALYDCHGSTQKWRQFFGMIRTFPTKTYIFAREIPVLVRIVVFLTNFIVNPYSKPVYAKFKKAVKVALLHKKRSSSFKVFLKHLRKDISHLELVIYSFVHKKKLLDVCMNKSNLNCNAISTIASKYQSYNPVYNFLFNYERQTTGLHSLPDLVLIKIIKCLSNSRYLFYLMITCKHLFNLGTRFYIHSLENQSDIVLHSTTGLCLQHKFFSQAFSKKYYTTTYQDPDLCVCSLCLTSCSCDFSKFQHAGEIKKLILRSLKLKALVIRSTNEFDFSFQHLNQKPEEIRILVPINITRFCHVLSLFNHYNSFEYMLDVRMYTKVICGNLNLPVIEHLKIVFAPTLHSYDTNLPGVRRILKAHLSAIKSRTEKMKKIVLYNCYMADEIFNFNGKFAWSKNINEIHFVRTKLKCQYLTDLKKFRSLSLLRLSEIEYEKKCRGDHFKHYLRTDFINFIYVPEESMLVLNGALLKIECRISINDPDSILENEFKRCRCTCENIERITDDIKKEMSSGTLSVTVCDECMFAYHCDA